MLRALRIVYQHWRRRPHYVLLALCSAVFIFTGFVFFPHITLLSVILDAEVLSVAEKGRFLVSFYSIFIATNTIFSGLLLLVTALLAGLQLALVVYYIRRRQYGTRDNALHVAGVGGLVSAVFGLGCAACGSVVAVGILSLFGGAGLVSMLPWQGLEFSLLGVGLLVFSILYLARRIDDPLVCLNR